MAEYWVNNQASGANDGTSEADGFLTINQAMSAITSGDTVWVKGGSAYTETVTVSNVGTFTDLIIVEGYTTTEGDGGKFTINAESVRTSCLTNSISVGVDAYYIFRNMIIENATSSGVDNSNRMDYCRYENCEFNNNGYHGLYTGGDAGVLSCTADGNTGTGIYLYFGNAIKCKTSNNSTGLGSSNGAAVFYLCTSFSESTYGISCGWSGAILNCTADGDSGDSNVGLRMISQRATCVFNSIAYDCNVGIAGSTTTETKPTLHFGGNNLVNANVTAYSDFGTGYTLSDITSAPSFTDEAGGDYTLASDSPARNAGTDLGTGSTGMDIGAYQSQDSGTKVIVTG